ncbi:MAG: hypothetical protein AB7K09_22345, partial [Planctomycetota bacterium]
MLVFSGATRVEQVVGIVDPRPHRIRMVNHGTTPLLVHDISLDADQVTCSIVLPHEAAAHLAETEAAAAAGAVPAAGSARPREIGRQLWQLQLDGHHVVQPGPDGAWLLDLYWDGTHPDARHGSVKLTVVVGPPDGSTDTVTRELAFQVSLQHLPVFEGLLSLDWGDANLRGAYIAREAFNPRPVPVLVGGGRRTDPFDMAGSDGPHHDEDDATAERSPGDAARRASSRLGTRASHYLDNVQDKFA